jgi:hypothetical protein
MPSFHDWQFCFSDFRDRMGEMIQEFIAVIAVVAKTIVKKVDFSAENHQRLEPPFLILFERFLCRCLFYKDRRDERGETGTTISV